MARCLRISTVVTGLALTAACSDVTSNSLPAGTSNPSTFHNAEGAMAMYNTAIYGFQQQALAQFIVATGILSDEMQVGTLGGSQYSSTTSGDERLDERAVPEVQAGQSTALESPVVDRVYGMLQATRGNVSQALGALAAYAPSAPTDLRGELYVTQGFTEIMLADLFCSGVPLSTVDFDKDYTYQPGSTTQQVYTHAIALFDTAITLSPDSVNILNAARVGKGRALLALGRYANAAAAVADVPATFQYAPLVDWSGITLFGESYVGTVFTATVVDREGGNGFPFISSGDPRTDSYDVGPNANGVSQYFPSKYGWPQNQANVTIADGIEAQLIQAEAALATGQGSQWLDMLNQLRSDAGLAPLDDPGTPETRVDLLFAERAAWLFVTGHRQGDLRRMIRQYGRTQIQVYPTGVYPGDLNAYGTDVTAPIPAAEWANPKFTGCIDRGA